MYFDGERIPDLKELNRLPNPKLGVRNVRYEFVDLDLKVNFDYVDEETGGPRSGTIIFEFVVALCIEMEENKHIGLPPSTSVLYGFDGDFKGDFRGYQIWLYDYGVITVGCHRVVIGNEVL